MKRILELLKNSLVPINKTASIAHFHKIETNGELIFQQFYCNKFISKIRMQNLFQKNNNFGFDAIL